MSAPERAEHDGAPADSARAQASIEDGDAMDAAARAGSWDPSVASYLELLVARAQSVLGPELVGAYVTGSVALGAYEPGRSDIDVALVTGEALSEDVKRHLVERLRHESLPCPARGLELVAYRAEVAAAGSPEPGFEMELNTGLRMRFRQTLRPEDRPPADGLFWYGLDRSLLHAAGITLVGPPASATFAAMDDADVRHLLALAVRWWLGRPAPRDGGTGPGAEAVLAACRALTWQRHRVWLSKRAAAQRLRAESVGPASVLDAAISARTGGPGPSVDAARAFQRAVLAELEAPDR